MVMSPILIYIHPFWRMYFQNESNKKIKNNKKKYLKTCIMRMKGSGRSSILSLHLFSHLSRKSNHFDRSLNGVLPTREFP